MQKEKHENTYGRVEKKHIGEGMRNARVKEMGDAGTRERRNYAGVQVTLAVEEDQHERKRGR